jgi:hypothetical protein
VISLFAVRTLLALALFGLGMILTAQL